MGTGAKVFWAFLGGAVVGAGGLAYLNKNKMDFRYMKPMATDLITKGLNLKDNVTAKMASMKEDFEDMTAEARDRLDHLRMSEKKPEKENSADSGKPA